MFDIEKRRHTVHQSTPESLINDPFIFIRCVRKGISGTYLREIVVSFSDYPEIRALILVLLETTSSNLHRFYRRKNLSRAESESVLDTIALVAYAQKIFGENEIALEWLQTPLSALSGEKPLSLCDTFFGRRLVCDVLKSIQYGEFS